MSDADDRYNRSPKGRARYLRYEAAHPERKERGWAPLERRREQAIGNPDAVNRGESNVEYDTDIRPF